MQAAELAAPPKSKHQLSFDASVQPDFTLFRGADNSNLDHQLLRICCPAPSPKATPSQHCHADVPHHTLLMMPSAIPTKLIMICYCCCLVLSEQVKQPKRSLEELG